MSTRDALPLGEKKRNLNSTISEALGQQHKKKSDLLDSHLQTVKRRKLEEPTKLEDLKRLRSRQKATLNHTSVTETHPYGLSSTGQPENLAT